MAVEKVNVSVADDYLDQFDEVVRRLEKAGLKVEQELEAIGVVCGSIDSAKLADFDKVEGIAAVEEQRDYQLAPPESDVQ